jgi:hypothetical protein
MTIETTELRRRLAAAIDTHVIVGELLGAGRSAAVFRAHDTVLDRQVAIKVIDPALAAAADLETAFLQEAQIVASLEHPNIVPLYTAQSRDGLLYLVMRLLDGESLTHHLADGVCPPAEAARIALDVAGALAAAHARGVVHRDIKPDNVLLDRDGRAIVTDFGIALVTTRAASQAEGVTSGTPGYMSPEQLLGEPVDGRSDIYAVGVLLFEMLTGRLPFVATSLPAMVAQHMTQPLPVLAALRPEVPTALVEITQQCLEKAVANRPTAAELVSLLTAAITPAALQSPAQVKRATRRRRLAITGSLAVAGGTVVVLLVAVVVRLLTLIFADGAEPALIAFYEAIPRAVIDEARAAGALLPDERVQLAFSQAGAPAGEVLLITDQHIVRRAGGAVRRYRFDDADLDLSRNISLWGPSTALATVTTPSGARDTVLAKVTGTEMLRLSSGLAALAAARDRARMTEEATAPR